MAAGWTRSEYMKLPEGFPAELIDGTLVREPSPSSWHQVLVLRVALHLYPIVGARRVLVSPLDVFVDDWNILQPDVLALSEAEPVRRGDRLVAMPILVVEVLSPSTRHRDRERKVPIYLRAGVKEVWLVDPATETAEIHTPKRVAGYSLYDTPVSRAVPGFTLPLAELFAD